MKFRQIAKQIVYARLADPIEAADGITYGENKQSFTPGQLVKAQAALDAYRLSLKKKLKKQGVKV